MSEREAEPCPLVREWKKKSEVNRDPERRTPQVEEVIDGHVTRGNGVNSRSVGSVSRKEVRRSGECLNKSAQRSTYFREP